MKERWYTLKQEMSKTTPSHNRVVFVYLIAKRDLSVTFRYDLAFKCTPPAEAGSVEDNYHELTLGVVCVG